ncbi:hypothetical protein Sjap_011352 [Stephania japonica]|uniref:Uncharacterized protein n=1 Tax=Stephania japonica TaxID=461633 RepID=A0AAP0JC91_9MAGN
MVGGGGNRRDDGPLNVHSTNVFAALESLRRKKKSDKDHGSKSGKGSSKSQAKEPEQPQTFWAPTPLTAKSWADVDDDDDDDYYATTAPPQPVWGSSKPQEANKESSSPLEIELENGHSLMLWRLYLVIESCNPGTIVFRIKMNQLPALVLEKQQLLLQRNGEKQLQPTMSESEEDGLDEGDDEVEDEHEHEIEAPVQTESTIKKPAEASLVQKDTERQLSKKELKKKELAELDAVLAELGISQSENNGQNDEQGGKQENASEEVNGDGEKKQNLAVESKTAKKKKKKEKSKESKEQNQPDEVAVAEPTEEDTSVLDVKERLKKVTSMKKKKSSKEMDAAARAAAIEAAARSAKLAAAKKKEKNHYNQQPVR